MKSYFKLEFKKAFFSWRTMISSLIILASLAIPYLSECRFPHPGLDGVDYYITICEFSYIGYIGPVVAGLIYSTSIIRDKETVFINKLFEIIDAKTYFTVKLAVNALITSIAFAVSHGIVIIYLIITYGINNSPIKGIASGAFMGVYDVSKISYIILMLLVVSLSSAAFSTFILGIVTAFEKKFIAYLLPIFYTIFTGVFFEIWSLNYIVDFNVTKLFNVMINTAKGFNVIIYDLILLFLGTFLLFKFGYRRTLAMHTNA
jgi:hypothetical protein